MISATACADMIYVNGSTGDDAWDGLCEVWDGGTCGPKATIQAGIDAADDGDEVVVADGTYTGGGNRDLNFGGKAVTVRSASDDPTLCIIDCGGMGRGFFFHNNEGPDSVVRGLRITNGDPDDTGPGGDMGGGVYCQNSSPTLTNCTIGENSASSYGGGVYCWNSSPTLTQCAIDGNWAYFNGGGIHCRQYSNPTLIDCTIDRNSATDGGGVFCKNHSDPELTNCTISENLDTLAGGGIYCCDQSSPTLVDCEIVGNSASIDGGGVYCENLSNPTLTECEIIGNVAHSTGGGIHCLNHSAPTLIDCKIDRNEADYGGGVFCWNYSAPNLTDCTISENQAAFHGGGVYCENHKDHNSPTLTNCNIAENCAEDAGGGIYCWNDSDPTLIDCRIGKNSAANGGGVFCENYSDPGLTDCTISQNRATSKGGGIYCRDHTSPTLTKCTISGNSATDYGGGVFCRNNSSPAVTGCRIDENSAPFGGGVYCRNDSGLTLTNCMINANSASIAGGGLYCLDDSGPTLTSCTMYGNSAHLAGGGVYCISSSSATLLNCIAWANSPDEIFEFGNASDTGVRYSNIRGGWPGEGNVNWDSLLTPDGHLTTGSPCIDEGNEAVLPADTADLDGDGDFSEIVPFDIDFDPRVLGSTVDIGADEFLDSDADGLPDWWEFEYFGTATAADPMADPDGDGLPNHLEYFMYGSDPTGVTWYVHATNGNDTWDGTAAHWEGGLVGPKQTIQAALDLAANGESVRVAGGTYVGPGNYELNFHKRSIVVVAHVALGGTTEIDCGGAGRAVDPNSLGTSLAVLEGFVIRDGAGDAGGAVSMDGGRLVMRHCTIEDSGASISGGGLYCRHGLPTLHGVTLRDNIAPENAGGAATVLSSHVTLTSPLYVETGELLSVSSWFTGQGRLELAGGTRLHVVGTKQGDPPTVFRTDIFGTGDIMIEAGQKLLLEQGALIDLSGHVPGDPNGPCADPNSFADWGTILVDGILVCRGATIRNTGVQVNAGELAGGVTIRNNEINLLQDPPGWGGELFVEGSSVIECNVIRSEGDRYLDLDPDPSIDPNDRPIIQNNKIYVAIVQGITGDQGELLELRTQDHDIDSPDPSLGYGSSGAYQLDSSAGYQDEWAFEQLEIRDDAKVNLTNRSGFDFQDAHTPEALYVTELKLHPHAVLNTGMQRLYYQRLVDEQGLELDHDQYNPGAPLSNGSRIVDIPLLGFSLKVITFEDNTPPPNDEFTIRVRTRLRDPDDIQPADPDYQGDPDDPPLEGKITRIPDSYDSNNHVMEMLAQAPGRQSASSVAAHGAFARASEDHILIKFNYRFCEVSDPNTTLAVYLSDSPKPRDVSIALRPGECEEHSCCCAWVYPPGPGRPGAVGSPEWATFHGLFPRNDLNFTRGTYVELELRGEDACIEIDDWDPQTSCEGACLDFSGDGGVSGLDFLLLLSECGQETSLDPDKECLDSRLSRDGYVDHHDLLAVDAVRSWEGTNLCNPPIAPTDLGTPTTGLPVTGLLVAGKPQAADPEALLDWLYAYCADGSLSTARYPPASFFGQASDPNIGYLQMGNGRLIRSPDGAVHQLHAIQGLVALATAERTIAPFQDNLAGRTVYVGVQDTADYWDYPDGYPMGLPLADVVFTDADTAYVTPVLVSSSDWFMGERYPHFKASAQLTYDNNECRVTQLYGNDYCDDVWSFNMDPCFESVNIPQGQRALAVDDAGYLLVLSSNGHSQGDDCLLVYDIASGNEEKRVVLSAVDSSLRNPASMLLSQFQSDVLYLASGLDEAEDDANTYLYRCQLDLSDENEPLSVTDVIAIQHNPTEGDYGHGHAAFITSIQEDPHDGNLYVVGYTSPRLSDDLHWTQFPSNYTSQVIPTLARISGSDVTVTRLAAGDDPNQALGLPLAALYLGAETIVGDLNCDGALSFADINPFVDALIDLEDYYSAYPCCNHLWGNIDGNGSVGFEDINPFVDLLLDLPA